MDDTTTVHNVNMGCQRILRALAKRLYRLCGRMAPLGSQAWLIGTELKYGGIVKGVKPFKVSPLDPRRFEAIHLQGGDRMFFHRYAAKYAQYMRPFIGKPITLFEIGILKGTGLAIWCDLFPQGRVVGLDIDTRHAQGNMSQLRARGAFQSSQPEFHEFDQLVDNRSLVASILDNTRIDICIDDGLHTDQAILMAMNSVMPYMADRFVYFVEDNASVHEVIAEKYPELRVDSWGELTVVSRGVV